MIESASDKLISKLKFDFEENPYKSVYFEYKKQQQEKEYNDKSGKKSEYKNLRSLYDAIGEAASAKKKVAVLEYLTYVKNLLSVKDKNEYLSEVKNASEAKNALDQFQERWRGYMSAFYPFKDDKEKQNFGFLKEKEKAATKIADAFKALDLPNGKDVVLDAESMRVLDKIQEELIRLCIKISAKTALDNLEDSENLSKDLIDLCEKKGLLKVGKQQSIQESDEQIKARTVSILKEIYSIEDKQMRNEYDQFFYPVLIDQDTGVSMCIVGKRTYEGYFYAQKILNDTKEEEWPYPCALTVLHFKVASVLRRYSTVAYEVSFPISKYSDIVDLDSLEDYFDCVRDEYIKARREALRIFHDTNLCETASESFKETILYDHITGTSKKAQNSDGDKEEKRNNNREKRKKGRLKQSGSSK